MNSYQRVTTNAVENNIFSEHYFTADHGRRGAIEAGEYAGREPPLPDSADLETLKLLTFCVLVLQNGFKVVGVSACVDPALFDAAVGRRLARVNAVEKIWPLMGYELSTKLQTP